MGYLSREEQETIIRSNASHEDWDLVTADPVFIRYAKRQGYEEMVDRQLGKPYVAFRVPFKRVRLLKREKRPVTQEQRDRMKKLHGVDQ